MLVAGSSSQPFEAEHAGMDARVNRGRMPQQAAERRKHGPCHTRPLVVGSLHFCCSN